MKTNTEIITAQEAREMAGPTPEERLESISNMIRKAAADRKRSIILRDAPYRDWLYVLKPVTEEDNKVIEALKEKGFTLSLHYKETQFVDYGLIISW